MTSYDETSKDLEIIEEILSEVELSQFLTRIRDELQVTKLNHFDFVKVEDLERIGLGRPAARRLLDAVRKKKSVLWQKNIKSLIAKILPNVGSSGNKINKGNESNAEDSHNENVTSSRLTCLIQEKDLEIFRGPKLGDGSFGVVKKGKWTTTKGTVKQVAVKILKQDVFHVPGVLEDFMREVQAMHALCHPNLICLYGVVLSNPLMMVTEIATYGSLLDYLHKQGNRISIQTFCDYALQIARGMVYLESKRFIHRDLAARNVLMSAPDKLKIGDFGLMRVLPHQEECYVMSDQKKVPFPWCAPESLRMKQFSHASDMWMFGVTLWEIFSFGEDPWVGLNGQQILRKIDQQDERLPCPNACPSFVYSLMLESWSKESSDRPSFSQMYERILAISLPRMKALETFEEDGRLKVAMGDEIVVIDGSSDRYWWKGQNQRTLVIGDFPRCITNPLRPLNQEDISNPLPNSFIHAGHAGTIGKRWGNPGFIDDMFLQTPMSPPDLIRDKSTASPKKIKQQSLRLKQKKRHSNYSKLVNENGSSDRDSGNAGGVSRVLEQEGDVQLISFNDSPAVIRQRSYSASELNKEFGASDLSPGNPLSSGTLKPQGRPLSEFQAFRNLSSREDVLPSGSLYQNINNHFSNTLPARVPVRPAPPIQPNGTNVGNDRFLAGTHTSDNYHMIAGTDGESYALEEDESFDDDEWDEESNFENCEQEANRIYANQPPEVSYSEDTYDPFDTSNIRLYDEPPHEEVPQNEDSHCISDTRAVNLPEVTSSGSSFKDISSQQSELANNKIQVIRNLNDQIGNMWLKNVSQNNTQSFQNNVLTSNTYSPHFVGNPPNNLGPSLCPQNRRQNVTFSSTVAEISNSISTSNFSNPNSLSCLSQSTPSLVPVSNNSNANCFNNQFDTASFKARETNFPKLDSNFIAELEKNLGKDQAFANTFSSQEKSVLTPTLIPENQSIIPNSFHHNSYNQETNLSASNPNLRQCLESSSMDNASQTLRPVPKATSNAFSDLDVLSSSKNLGLANAGTVDISQFFQKAHNKEFSPLITNQIIHSSQTQSAMLMDNRTLPFAQASHNSGCFPQMNFSNAFPIRGSYQQNMVPFVKDNVDKFPLINPSVGSQQTNSPQLSYQLANRDSVGNPPRQTTEILQPTLVVSPQLTVNYNQVVCSGGDGTRNQNCTEISPDVLVGRVAAMVPGTSLNVAKQALHVAAGDFKGAVEYLKEEKLYRLGITDKTNCRRILESNSWELERSASVLLDKFSS